MFEQEVCVSPYNFEKGVVRREDFAKKITIYDSTLRDGEQMPGVFFDTKAKIAVARALDDIGVPQIEAGFPAVSAQEKKTVARVKKEGLCAEILALSRLRKDDIDTCIDCDVDMVLLFIASSPLHLKYKLRMTESEVIKRTQEMVGYAKEHGLKTSFSTEDTTRTDLDFLRTLNRRAEESGADRIGITDTVGCITPEGLRFLISKVKEDISSPFSIHLHNDFGLVLANALAAAGCGASAFTTTVNGIGERGGNLPLEEFAVAMSVFYKRDLGIELAGLKKLSELVAKLSGIRVPKNKPLVGQHAFSHESGIHVAATLSCPMTYEAIPPTFVGGKRRLVLGKHTGSALVRERLGERNIKATKEEIGKILADIKKIGEEKGRVSSKEFWETASRHVKHMDDHRR